MLLAALAMSTLTQWAWAQDKKLTPTRVEGVTLVSTDEAHALVGKAHFYDLRSPVNFGKGHIRGAKALPYSGRSENSEQFDATQDRFEVSALPSDKSAVLVLYSDGPGGWKSYKAAVQAVRAGYRNVRWFRDGVDGWTQRGLPLE